MTSNEARDGVLTHEASYVDPNVELNRRITATENYAAHAAIVEVDDKTGKVRVVDYVAAHDFGTALNPTLLEGQITGAVVMGLGAALGEELLFEQGKLINPAFIHYPVPRAADAPKIRTVLKGVGDPKGPYGAKGVGEVEIEPARAMHRHAVYDAVGLRIRSLPITPDKIVAGLAAREGRHRRFHIWRRPGRWYIAMVRWAYPRGLFALLHARQMRRAALAPPPPRIELTEAPVDITSLVRALGPDSAIIGGGTDLQPRRNQDRVVPRRLISVSHVIEMQEAAVSSDGSIVVGGGVKLTALAEMMRDKIPAVAEAIDEIATPQVRNVATVAGNLLQEKRCWFFRNKFPCYKRMDEAS